MQKPSPIVTDVATCCCCCLSTRIEGGASWDFGEIDPRAFKKAMSLSWFVIWYGMKCNKLESVFPKKEAMCSPYLCYLFAFLYCISCYIILFCKSRFRDMLLICPNLNGCSEYPVPVSQLLVTSHRRQTSTLSKCFYFY